MIDLTPATDLRPPEVRCPGCGGNAVMFLGFVVCLGPLGTCKPPPAPPAAP